MPTTTRTLPDLTDLVPTLQALLRPEDLLVIVSARRGTVSWRPGLDRLPQVAATRFEWNTLIVAYPAVEEPEFGGPVAPPDEPDPEVIADPANDQSLTNAPEPTR